MSNLPLVAVHFDGSTFGVVLAATVTRTLGGVDALVSLQHKPVHTLAPGLALHTHHQAFHVAY
jgi:hypothetical protein